jgi:hypothetical protein
MRTRPGILGVAFGVVLGVAAAHVEARFEKVAAGSDQPQVPGYTEAIEEADQATPSRMRDQREMQCASAKVLPTRTEVAFTCGNATLA